MPAVLSDYQFELDGFVFGRGLPVFVDSDGFDPGDYEKITQDGVNPITGARMFGRDMHGSTTWTFSCHVDREDPVGALETLEAMGATWLDEKWLEPDNIAMLRYAIGGRTRVVFGKPRRFGTAMTNTLIGGHLPPVATFDLSDTKHYADTEQILDLGVYASVPGGFEAPLVFPLVIELPADSSPTRAVTVGGTTKTGLVIEFTGPLTDGSVTIGDLEIGFVGTLPDDSKFIIDARPWSMGITRVGPQDGVALSRATRLTRALLAPGSYQAHMRGTDQTGTAQCRVRWRDAYATL
jgi:hypothetical protein